MLRFLTAGESHGPQLTAIIEGLPAGLPLTREPIDAQLARRQGGYGRGGRMKIERDAVQLLSGVRLGRTTGAPVTLVVENRDWANWTGAMSAEPRDATDAAREAQLELRRISKLRPGHADFAGALKYHHEDVRDVLERASARETTMRVAVGAVARELLAAFGVAITSHVVSIGAARADQQAAIYDGPLGALAAAAEASPVRCAESGASERMVAAIDEAKRAGTSLGGVIEVRTTPLPVGLGSHVHWDRRLDARLAMAVMSIHAIKGVEFGLGFAVAERPGFEAHDTFQPGFGRPTNYAGGVEGGMSNGQPLVLRAAMKPIATMPRPLDSVDLATGEAVKAHFERADTCAVPAAGVIAEAMVAWVLAEALLEKYGGDSMAEIAAHYRESQALQDARLRIDA
ncbi:MAG TPA: chorismate synthase [Oscillatoriaceae cyanobacterium]